MGRGFRIFTLFGIPVHIDWTFLVVVPLFTLLLSNNLLLYAQWVGLGAETREALGVAAEEGGPMTIGRPLVPLVFGLFMTIGLYASVLVHEFGHALTARLFGVKTRQVTLWFLGGVAGFERMPRQPGAEAVVAVVGPLTSLAVAGVLAAAFVVVPDGFILTRLTLGALSVLNIVLAVFNMLPALPLDGGRVLRSLLALAMPYMRATRITAGLSKAIAAALVLWGLFGGGGIMLVAVAVFVWLAVSAETRQSAMESMLKGVKVSDLMTRDVAVLPDRATVADLLLAVQQTRHSGFPVVDDESRVVGMVGLMDLNGEAGGTDPRTPVRSLMREGCLRTTPDMPAVAALEQMAGGGFGRCAVVGGDGRLVGLVTKADLMHFLQMQSLRGESPTLFPAPRPVGSDRDDPYRHEPYRPPRPFDA